VAAFTPSVDVNASGDVAVTFYDFRNDTPTPTPRSRTLDPDVQQRWVEVDDAAGDATSFDMT